MSSLLTVPAVHAQLAPHIRHVDHGELCCELTLKLSCWRSITIAACRFHPSWCASTAKRLVDSGSPLLEQPQALRGCSNHHAAIGDSSLHEPAFTRVLPHRKPRTGCPPGLHRFLVGAFAPFQPFDQIEDEVLDGVSHTVRRRVDRISDA